MAGFEVALKKFHTKVDKRASLTLRFATEGVLRSVIDLTPADTGQAKGNWRVRRNTAPRGIVKRKDPSGSKAFTSGARVASRARNGDTMHVANNLFYVRFINDGTVRQQPKLMVERTEQKFRTIVSESLTKAISRTL